MAQAQRLVDARDLGRPKQGLDLALGICAVLPLVLLAAYVLLVGPSSLAETLAVIWSACLLGFFAGVRRGLTFSEASGGRAPELLSMLAVFFAGVLTLLLGSPLVAAAGFACVGALDALAARRREAPGYFIVLRPLQMAVCVAALLAITLRAR